MGISFIVDLFTDGRQVPVALEDIASATRPDALRWYHIHYQNLSAVAWLRKELGPVTSQALLNENTRPRATHCGDGILVILRGVNSTPGEEPEDMVSIRLWVEENRLISVYRRPLLAVTDLQDEIARGTGPRTAGDFIKLLAYKLTENMEPVVTDISDRADALEDLAVGEDENPARSDIANLRREAIILRRYFAPQKDAFNRLSTDSHIAITDLNRLDLREAADRVTRLVEDLDAVRERCAVLNDQLVDQRAEEMNRNMFLLSIVAAIFLPLGFLTGLLGVNVGGIPGTGNPYAFLILCFFMTIVGLGIVVFFRKMKWL